MFSTNSLVNTNVEPPSVAESEAKNVPRSKFLKNILSLFMKSYLLDYLEVQLAIISITTFIQQR